MTPAPKEAPHDACNLHEGHENAQNGRITYQQAISLLLQAKAALTRLHASRVEATPSTLRALHLRALRRLARAVYRLRPLRIWGYGQNVWVVSLQARTGYARQITPDLPPPEVIWSLFPAIEGFEVAPAEDPSPRHRRSPEEESVEGPFFRTNGRNKLVLQNKPIWGVPLRTGGRLHEQAQNTRTWKNWHNSRIYAHLAHICQIEFQEESLSTARSSVVARTGRSGRTGRTQIRTRSAQSEETCDLTELA